MVLGSNEQDIYYVLFFCEKICLQGICILGDVKEEEDGEASPPPFQPGAQQPAASGAASINDRYHSCMDVTMPSMTPLRRNLPSRSLEY